MDTAVLIFVIFLGVGIGVALGPIAISWLLWYRKRRTIPTKELLAPQVPDETPWLTPEEYARKQREPYESGMPSVGPWRHIGYEYIIFAILFLIFDMLFVMLFFSLGAWLKHPKLVGMVLIGTMAISLLMIFYALKPRKYLRL